MLKPSLDCSHSSYLRLTIALVGLSLSLSAQSAIIDLGNITRDTDTGLDWLDVTETLGLSYNEVTAQMGAGGAYEGWRYATMAELDQLIIDFGYAAVNLTCPYTALHCDSGLSGDSPLIELMINTLGDTYDAWADAQNDYYFDVSPQGAGETRGILGSQNINPPDRDYALIYDGELNVRATQAQYGDYDDVVRTANAWIADAQSNPNMGSFLVQSVPIPAAAWLFGSALLGLGALKKREA